MKARTATCIACDAIIVLKPIGVPRRHCDDCRYWFVTAKQRAGNKVSKAVYTGQMEPATNYKCADCGRPAAVWDHRDYRLPLQVEPTCKRCNALRGPAIWDGAKNKPDAPDCAAFTLLEWKTPLADRDYASGDADRGSQSVSDLSGKPTTDVVGSAT
jgi:DNA-directed RNA polymerase subunit RPC12/RpoP